MCGIVGQINFDRNEPVAGPLLLEMADCIRHRGPDAEGSWLGGNAGLAHRRLSIIDLSASANQPLCNEDETVWIVFNGEIYNFQELREPLLKKGHRFRSRGDTETLVHLYEERGVEMLRELRGMFAFAIWDSRRNTLFAARDRIGKKPFKYFSDGRRLVFASELKALLRHPAAPRELDAEAIHQYLGFGYLFAPRTGLSGIRKLPPAHYLLLQDGKLTIERYWQLDYRNKYEHGFEQCREELLAHLNEAVRLRLISDVPLGAFLSGGVDSSAVVALMARHSAQPVRTFSIGFDYEQYNELPYARQVAEQYQTEHTEHVVKVAAAQILPELVRLYEEPYADSSALPSYYLARVTRQAVTVALNGDGGDENFFGYQRYPLFNRTRALVRRIERLRAGWLLTLARVLPGSFLSTLRRRAGVIQGLLHQPDTAIYGRMIFQFTDELKHALYSPEFRRWIERAPNAGYLAADYDKPQAGDQLNRALLWDIEQYLPEDLCVKMDIATMAHGLETRSPFLDHRFMEFCASIPPEWKFRGGAGKHILKKALARLLPDSILHRRKQGFGIPLHEWFRGELKELYGDLLLAPDARATQFLARKGLEELLRRHVSGAADEGYRLWLLTTLELWLRSLPAAVARMEQ